MKNSDIQCQSSNVSGLLPLGASLRTLNLTAQDHIDQLIPELNELLKFCKKNCNTPEQKQIYEKFEIEFNQRVSDQSISYEYWIIMAFRISILITDKPKRTAAVADLNDNSDFLIHLLEHKKWETHEDMILNINEFPMGYPARQIKHCISEFPRLMMIPTGCSEISIHHLNRLLTQQIYPLRLIHTAIIEDGETLEPDRYIRYQLMHVAHFRHLYWDSNEKLNAILFFAQYCLQHIQNSQDIRVRFGLDFLLHIMLHVEISVFYEIHLKDDKEIYRQENYTLKNFFAENNSIYTIVEDDKWFGQIIKPLLTNQYPNTRRFINHMTHLMDELIIQFFREYGVSDLTNYRFVQPEALPTSDEVNSHWTKKPEAQTVLAERLTFYTGNKEFMTWLVKNDKSEPESFTSWHILMHLISWHDKWSSIRQIKPSHSGFFQLPMPPKPFESRKEDGLEPLPECTM